MKPGFQATIGDKLVAQQLCARVPATEITHELDKVSVMKSAEHFYLYEKFSVTLMASSRKLLDCNLCAILQHSSIDTAKSTLSQKGCRIKIVGGFPQIIIDEYLGTGNRMHVR